MSPSSPWRPTETAAALLIGAVACAPSRPSPPAMLGDELAPPPPEGAAASASRELSALGMSDAGRARLAKALQQSVLLTLRAQDVAGTLSWTWVDCPVSVSYAGERTPTQTQSVTVSSKSQLSGKMPFASSELVSSSQRGTHIEFRSSSFYALDLTELVVELPPGKAACDEATHYVSGVLFGNTQWQQRETASATRPGQAWSRFEGEAASCQGSLEQLGFDAQFEELASSCREPISLLLEPVAPPR